jgi:hypothetical protein
MKLYKTSDTFFAKTVFGEWAAKQAGFTWDKAIATWKTQDVAKALLLAQQTGLTYESALAVETAPAQNAIGGNGLPKWPTVSAGRYAIPFDGVLKFYRVDRPTEGKWAGRLFLKVCASDNTWPVKDPKTQALVMDAIAVDPFAALCLYGKELGHCGHCGKALTDSESRRLGIGPICRGKFPGKFTP